jgi:hypothetical protein
MLGGCELDLSCFNSYALTRPKKKVSTRGLRQTSKMGALNSPALIIALHRSSSREVCTNLKNITSRFSHVIFAIRVGIGHTIGAIGSIATDRNTIKGIDVAVAVAGRLVACLKAIAEHLAVNKDTCAAGMTVA